MALREIEHLLLEKRRYKKLNMLEQAYYNSCLIMQENYYDIYINLRDGILGIPSITRIKNDIERYKMISERLKLKFPGGGK
jgi:hypothetical protein